MQDYDKLNKRLQRIEQRNKRVEADKAWETCFTRVASITVITYIIASVVMWFIGVGDYLLNALIPTIGYILSTQSLPLIKKWWTKNYLK